MPSRPPTETRLSAIVVALAVAAFLLVRFVAPAPFETPDEAKYVGLGFQILEGRGLVTVFGVEFANHSPVWALVLAAPMAWFGVDGVALGQALNGLSGAAVIGLAASLGWRVRPLAGALAAVILLGFPYLLELSRTASLDMPATALGLGYLVAGLGAVRSGWAVPALLAGALFSLSFLVKETALPLAPVPFLAGLAAGVRWPRVARQAALALLVTVPALGWWFLLHASITGEVYRLGAPAWLLAPLAGAVVVAIVLGLAAEPIARRLKGRTGGRRTDGDGQRAGGRPGRPWGRWLAWLAVGAWAAAQLVVYARAPKLAGTALVDPSAIAAYAVFLPLLGPILATGGVGGLLAAGWPGVAAAAARRALEPMAMALLVHLPLVLLVVRIGETPRHYVAALALLAVVGAAGWVRLAEAAASTTAGDRRMLAAGAAALGLAAILALAGLPRVLVGIREAPLVFVVIVAVAGLVAVAAARRTRPATAAGRAWLPSLAIGGLLIIGTTVATATAARPQPGESTKRAVVAETAAWLQANAPPGSRLLFGPFGAYELALRLRAGHETLRIRPTVALVDPAAPLGLRTAAGRPLDDAVAVEPALRNVDQFDVLSAAGVAATIARARPDLWIQVTRTGEGIAIRSALDEAAGLEPVASWSHPFGPDERIEVVVYRVDLAAFALRADRLYADPVALGRVVGALESAGVEARDAARALRERAVIVPDGTATDGLLARLEALAGR